MTAAQKAERAARRRNQRAAERAPLLELSGDLHHWTADEIEAEGQRYDAQLQEVDRLLADRARSFRDRVARLVSAEELARLDEMRTIYPASACYSADFWRRQLNMWQS